LAKRPYKPQRIAGDVVVQALKLLDQGQPMPAVASNLGIGLRTVLKIKRGELVGGAPAARCPGCGGKLLRPTAPCLACNLRRSIDAAG
jgi:hypothetical protein